jgi:RTX calcium-binding nonapeptide repeat (4 copies)
MGRTRVVICATTAAVGLAALVPASQADDPPPLGTAVQGAQSGSLTGDALRGTLFVAGTTTTIGKVRAFLSGTGSSQTVMATVYVSSFSEPNRLVGFSQPQVVSAPAGGQWVELTLGTGTRIEQGREYWLLLHSGSASGSALSIAFAAGGSNRDVFRSIGYPGAPDPFGGGGAFDFRTYSIHALADAALPQSTAAPAVSDLTAPGPGTHQLSVSNGTWSNASTFTYQWQRCFPNGVTNFPEDWCEDIAGATGSTLAVTPQPLTTRFRAIVTAQNARGRVARGSNVFVLDSPTTNVVRPAVTGSATVGSTLVSTFGQWIGLGTQPATAPPIERLRLRWQRCQGSSCTDIAGATATSSRNLSSETSTYVPTAADLGYTLRTVVVGRRDGLSSEPAVTATSDPTGAVGSGGGGGGGGGGTSVPDLGVSLGANRTTLLPDGDADVVATVRNTGGAGSLQTHLVIQLPSTMTLVGPPAVDRGTGCTGTQVVDCFLDYVPNGGQGTVRFSVRVSGSGAQALRAAASSDREANPADNAATLTFQVESPSMPPPPPTASRGVTRSGTSTADTMNGTAFADVLRGLAGNDRLNGRGGNDRLFGGAGHDALTGGAGIDLLDAGAGNDRISARDGIRDTVRCGPGRDTVVADRRDSVSRNCETVRRPGA